MRNITLTITTLFLVTLNLHAQSEIDKLTYKLTEVFENTKAVKELTLNRKVVLGQLEDIQLWQDEGSLSNENAANLAISYTRYAQLMNGIAEDIKEDLQEIKSYKDLKGNKLNRFVKKFEKQYNAAIQEAYEIYNTAFLPNFENASVDASSKVGIIGSILLVLEFGDTIVSTIKGLFSKDGLSDTSKNTLVSLSINLVSDKLIKQLTYPTWETTSNSSLGNQQFSRGTQQYVIETGSSARKKQVTNLLKNPAYSAMSNTASETLKTENNTERTPLVNTEKASIGLQFFNTSQFIPLEKITKSIIVGNTKNTPQNISKIALYATQQPMENGDKFWVTLQGDQHATFFYFDEQLQSWQDPFGKGIVVGNTSSHGDTTNNITVKLPAENSYFEITEGAKTERFFILLSNKEIPSTIATAIIGEEIIGVSFLEALEKMLPLQYPETSTTAETLPLQFDETTYGPAYYAIYVTIEKSNTQ